MSNIRPEDNIINEIEVLQRKMIQSIGRLAGSGNPQVTSINLELKDFVRELDQVREDLKKRFEKDRDEMEARFKKQQERLEALAGIGAVINSSLDHKRVMDKVMDALIGLMKAERGFLMLKDDQGDFQVQIARDVKHNVVSKDDFEISKSIVRQVLENGEAVLTTSAKDDPRFGQQASVAAFSLLSILCAPLKVKDKLIGVIYVDNRAQKGIFTRDELELISTFANQAAVAIENARLYEELQTAYQATLEGWVRALDMRDKETEGHTKRVTLLTGELARRMGLDESSLVHIERGALLHDIGKMAIPDGILLKPAALTPEERILIEKHPVYAFEMLSPIKFLHPALDIPYCHHEKWDGSGYPRKLSGETIPLAARIFAVVDVWDALVSDRPYRKGLEPGDVKQKLRDDAGKHFDPQVVDAFLGMDDQTLKATAKIN